MRVLKRTVLRNTSDGHYKFYEVNLCEDNKLVSDYRYAVVARWGRIEKFDSDSTPQMTKQDRRSKYSAQGGYEVLIAKKKKRGYKEYAVFNYAQSYKEVNKKTAKAKPVSELGDRTEILETPVETTSWWKGAHDLDREL